MCLMAAESLLRLLDCPKVFVIKKDDSDYIQYDKKFDWWIQVPSATELFKMKTIMSI